MLFMGFSLPSPSLLLTPLAFSAFATKTSSSSTITSSFCFSVSGIHSQRLFAVSSLQFCSKRGSERTEQATLANANSDGNFRDGDASSSSLCYAMKRKGSSFSVPRATPKESSSKLESENETENLPDWAKPDSDVPPPWARDKSLSSSGEQQLFEPPFFVYLIGSSLVAIAAVGSIFEFFNKRAVFGIIQPDSPFYTPILGFFAVTGLPTSAFLWYKSIQLANKLSEEQDKEDGFLDS
ncbi:hypothetical protein O6H91_Y577800 [Diphasiastrum complanatum]|nr:hypothetical protein O6H91_Y577800 [Diphasiastrum complanatum]